MSQAEELKRCNLILEMLSSARSITSTEQRVFQVMVSLNEQNFPNLPANQMMEKHQESLDYIILNS